MKKVILILIMGLFSIGLQSQNFEVPKDYKLKKAEDYASYENTVIDCVNWLETVPLNEQVNKRKDANTFLLEWVSGSPNTHVEINQAIVTFSTTSPGMLMVFIGGWVKYALEEKGNDDKVAGGLAGLESVIEVYKSNKNIIGKDKNIEKYIKMQSKGKLLDYVRENS